MSVKMQYVQYASAAATLVILLSSSPLSLSRLLAAVGCACSVVSIDLLYRVQLAKCRARWEQEHENFQRWIRSDLDRRR